MNTRMTLSTIDRIDRLEIEARRARNQMIRAVVRRLWKKSPSCKNVTLRVGHA